MNEVSVVKEGWLHKRGEGGSRGAGSAAVASLQGRVTPGNPALQLLPGKESSGFQLPTISTFPQCKCRGVSASPHPKSGREAPWHRRAS